MDHGFSFNRKRKADSDDRQDAAPPPISVDAMLVDQAAACCSSAVIWNLAPETLWEQQPTVPDDSILNHPPPKRPRHDKHHVSPRPHSARRLARRFPTRMSPARPPPTDRCGSDVEDIGVIGTASGSDPGPSTGSLLSLRGPSKAHTPPTVSFFSFESNSHHIPPFFLLSTVKVSRNWTWTLYFAIPSFVRVLPPCVSYHNINITRKGHDLLFDSGLQFRPTGSKRKKELSEKYWNAIITELETGCTCVSFDSQSQPTPTVLCACHHIPLPSDTPVSTISPSLGIVTIRMPSRIRPLLTEFLQVLISVLQPLSSISGIYVNPVSFKSQAQEHRDQASHIHSIFDPALIEQELKHRVFDPSGLFRAIGNTLKAHCAPIRDKAVEAMIQMAEAAGHPSRSESVMALRQCMDILELMKLDIANHQIQTLQPYLKRSAGVWELRTFKALQNQSSLTVTREWIWRAHSSMLSRSEILFHPSYPGGLNHRKLNRNQQLYIATLKGLTDLVFTPPIHISPSSLPSPSATPPAYPTTPLPGYPETFYLDNNRLVLLSADISDLTALYMFLLLYRQLVCSINGNSGSPVNPRVDAAALVQLKNEIRAIGSSRLGHCFLSPDSSSKDDAKWRRVKHDVVLQIAMRARESQLTLPRTPVLSTPSSFSPSSAPPSPTSPPLSVRSSPSCTSIGPVPDERTLAVAQKWADLNIQPASSLTNILRDRLRDVVFNAVVAMSYPGRDSSVGKLSEEHFLSLLGCTRPSADDMASATGMEPFAEEIRSLAEKISRLALIHLNAFLPLYEHPNFLELMA
ncbi:Tcp11-domain-containing protein [Hymenopellis radicata]|nr:Tcp11-domain-containing protein [Hymenopellis radicata]